MIALYYFLVAFLPACAPSIAINVPAQLEKARECCLQENLNTEICILIDMSVHSGKDRLFVYDMVNDSLLRSGLCSHGCCDNEWSEDDSKTDPVFSNTPESHCSSLGKYKVGKRGYSNWGIHVNYKLHGLESTNSNAYDRLIVLHSWDMVPEEECYPNGTPEGWGCPAVSNSDMRYLDKIFRSSDKPILLWIYK